jgi:hypothetical protein
MVARTLRFPAVLTVVIIVPITQRFIISRSLLLDVLPRCSNVGSLRRGNRKRMVRYTLIPTSYEVNGMVMTRLTPIMQKPFVNSSSRKMNDSVVTAMYPPVRIRYLIDENSLFTNDHCNIKKPHLILKATN